jgi:hypothetical protein
MTGGWTIALVIAGLALSIGCVVGGVIVWRRQRRVLGAALIGLGLFVSLSPIPTLQIKVEIPPTQR